MRANGSLVERPGVPWISEVTEDAVQHFAWGIGDANPLWLDPGRPEAPPCLLYAVDETTVAPGFDHLARRYRSVDWEWFDVVRWGSLVTATRRLVDTVEIDGGVVDQYGLVEFHGPTLIATARTVCRREAHGQRADEPGPRRYGPEELALIDEQILAERRRGDEIRYIEDVAAGDPIGRLTKGPLSVMDVLAWISGTCGIVGDAAGHSSGGISAGTATGPEVVSWLAQLVTDWMGDAGFLRRLMVDLHATPPLGSTTMVTGTVTAVRDSSTGPVAELAIEANDWDGEPTASGRAWVTLMGRDGTAAGHGLLPADVG